MNTINHYVGMFPIATGAPVEKPLAKFFFGFFAVMLLGFIGPRGRKRVLVLAAGFAAVAVWMRGATSSSWDTWKAISPPTSARRAPSSRSPTRSRSGATTCA
jgi:hypothetical protein